MVQGSPHSTIFELPGNRTIGKIVLSGDWFSTKIGIYDFWIFKVPFLCSKKFKSVLILQDLGPIFKRHSKITKVIDESVRCYKEEALEKSKKVVKQKVFEKKFSENVQKPNKLFKIWLNLFKIPKKIVLYWGIHTI